MFYIPIVKKKLAKDLAGLERKLDEIDKLLSTARVMINEMFWDIKTSIEKNDKKRKHI